MNAKFNELINYPWEIWFDEDDVIGHMVWLPYWIKEKKTLTNKRVGSYQVLLKTEQVMYSVNTISIIIPSLHTKNSAHRHTIPMKLLWHLADMPTMFGKSWGSIVPLAFCTMRIFVIPRVRSVVYYQLCCTAILCMCTGIASFFIYFLTNFFFPQDLTTCRSESMTRHT